MRGKALRSDSAPWALKPPASTDSAVRSTPTLDSEQQGMLNDFRERWQDLPVEKRERLVERADRWRNLSAERVEMGT